LLEAALTKCEMSRIRVHDLRHVFASYFVMSGGDIFTLQRILPAKTSDLDSLDRWHPNWSLRRDSVECRTRQGLQIVFHSHSVLLVMPQSPAWNQVIDEIWSHASVVLPLLLGLISALGAAGAFVWSNIDLVLARRREREAREFEAFHKLLKELVSPDEKTAATRVDWQVAVVFELRNFERYYEVAIRTLIGLRETWSQHEKESNQRLLDETDRTLSYIWKKLSKKRRAEIPEYSIAALPKRPRAKQK
jgi:hypothetical protein